MRDLISDVIGYFCYRSCDVDKISVNDKILIKNRKPEKVKFKNYLYKFLSKGRFTSIFHTFLRKTDARKKC